MNAYMSGIRNLRLGQISAVADKFNKKVYLVGGALRDILLKRKILDLDIVVEGDASRLVKELSRLWKAKIVSYPEFGTYILKFQNGVHIDFATARKETYPVPGSLPVVTFSNLKDDLFRRDFTINAMALSLNGSCKGNVIDLYGGQKDLKNITLKVLHKESFKDDATRILRMARFMSRGYKADKNTLKLVKEGKKYLKNIAAERIREELLPILKEQKPFYSLCQLKKWGILKAILPEVKLEPAAKKIDKAGSLPTRLNILFSGMTKEQRLSLMQRLKLQRTLKNEIEKLNQPQKKAQLLTGKDLIKLGYQPGPIFKEILNNISKKGFISRLKALQFVIDNYPQKR